MKQACGAPVFVLYVAVTNHTYVQEPNNGARFFRDHVDDGQWGASSSYWMVPGASHPVKPESTETAK